MTISKCLPPNEFTPKCLMLRKRITGREEGETHLLFTPNPQYFL
jgi:hypothetical protein